MNWLRATFALVRKDLMLEWRSRTRLLSIVLFGVTALALFSFGVGPRDALLREIAPTFIILALMLASTLGLQESYRLEQTDGALEGLLLLPVDAVAVFYSKAIGNTIFLGLLGPLLLPFAILLYNLEMSLGSIAQALALWVLVAAALSAPGALYAAMTSKLESQDVLLPLLLFPLVVPVLMASAKAMGLILHGDAMEQLPSWTVFLVAFNMIYWALGGVLFRFIFEERR